ncbi:hypothetical protein KFK09_000511 [Dendrobium nobile]|uniref:Uncharacterized protein n=1 Tax=Dendrobium nobile TaxID=94219 RepID=A0A8T3CC26_DENNO|nr:hypothetical protein KFK09_000511 [Dendrobium nobile]
MDRFLKIHHPTFNVIVGPIESDAWVDDIEKRLHGIKCLKDRKVDMVAFQLREDRGSDELLSNTATSISSLIFSLPSCLLVSYDGHLHSIRAVGQLCSILPFLAPMDESSTTTSVEGSDSSLTAAGITNPPQLKFFMSNVKTMVIVQLTSENHFLWKSQLLKLFTANNFECHLTGSSAQLAKQILNDNGASVLNPLYTTWMLIDQHLASAIYSTVSPSLLPYVLNLNSTHEIWVTLERLIHSSNRSRLLQLKGELHQLQLGDKTIFQYLSDIKNKVDAIVAAGSSIDAEDIIHYTLNGLPATYLSFKIAIRTQLNPISLDDFYSLLRSEELHLNADINCDNVGKR